MAVFTEEQKKLTAKLIAVVTGFTPPEENYKLCFQFCKSNFKFHRFLGVNDYHITQKINGLVEKFHVNSQPEKAESFKELCDRFLSCYLERSFPYSDAHYGVLSFLLTLSHSPLHATFVPAKPTTPPVEEVDGFDWTSYLTEGIEYPRVRESDSEEWTESGSEHVQEVQSDQNDSAMGDENLSIEDGDHYDKVSDSKAWLKEHVSVPYWKNQNQTSELPKPAASAHSSCQLAEKWNSHMLNSNPFCHPSETVYLSESQVVRETIWVLLEAEQSFVYSIHNEGIRVKQGVGVSHLTPLALYSLLEYFCSVATKLHKMRQFCQSILEGGANYVRCHTYEAFVSGLSSGLRGILKRIRNVEKDIVENKQMITLLRLSEDCKEIFDLVNGLYEIFERGILHELPQPSARQCSARLIDSLWAGMVHFDLMAVAGEELLGILYPLWVRTVRPYMEMLDSWMTSGCVTDKFKEFCIVRNMELEIKAVDYWEVCFTVVEDAVPTFLHPVLECVLLAGKSLHLMESIGKLKHIQEGVAHSSPSRGCLPTPSKEDLDVTGTTIFPSGSVYQEFLRTLSEFKPSIQSCDRSEFRQPSIQSRDRSESRQPSIQSRDMSESRQPSIQSRDMSESRQPSTQSYDRSEFRQPSTQSCDRSESRQPSIQSRDRSSDASFSVDNTHGQSLSVDQQSTNRSSNESIMKKERRLVGHSHYDSLMKSYMDWVDSCDMFTYSEPPDMWGLQDILRGRYFSIPLTLLIQNSLFPLLHERYRTASGALVELLRSEFNLMDHIRVMQLFFLMEAGIATNQLIDDIFQRALSENEVWQDSSYLAAVLQESIQYIHGLNQDTHCQLEKRLSLSLSPGNPSPSSLILHYSVPWPLDVLFSENVMETYNSIFQLLLHVRWAKWNLEGISSRTSTISAMERGVALKVHFLYLLRSRLLHFVNSLSYYLMTRVLHSVGEELRQSISMATDLEGILRLHSNYLHTIYDRCFLNSKASLVHKAMITVLKIALRFRQCWERGVAHFDIREAEDMEVEFLRSCIFLVTCLNKAVQRGSSPHLETLAFSLQPLKTVEKIFTDSNILRINTAHE